MEKPNAFSRCLRVVMKLKRMSNKQLASLVATDEGTVSRWLTGKHTPSKKRIELIESVMGVPKGTLHNAQPLTSVRQDSYVQSPALVVGSSSPATLVEPERVDKSESADDVLREFNVWLEERMSDGTSIVPTRVAEWMYRMWRCRSTEAGKLSDVPFETGVPYELMACDLPPSTGAAIVSEHGTIVEVNEGLVDLLGISRDQLIGKQEWDLFAPEYRSALKHRLRLSVTDPVRVVMLGANGVRLPVRKTTLLRQVSDHAVRVIFVEQSGSQQQCFIGANGD
jgi:PAS domain S-box-containing protein